MHIELFRLSNIVSDSFEDEELEKALCHDGLSGDKEPGRFEARIRSPRIRSCDVEDVFPIRECWDDLEGFGKSARLVARQKKSNSVLISIRIKC